MPHRYAEVLLYINQPSKIRLVGRSSLSYPNLTIMETYFDDLFVCIPSSSDACKSDPDVTHSIAIVEVENNHSTFHILKWYNIWEWKLESVETTSPTT